MVKISRFLRPSLRLRPPVAPPTDEELQRVVFDLVHNRLLRTLGPGGSFAVTIRRDGDDAFFTETFAETIAWEIAATLRSPVIQSPAIQPPAIQPAVIQPARLIA